MLQICKKTANPTPAQKELEMNDILNSAMLNRAKELFDIKKNYCKNQDLRFKFL